MWVGTATVFLVGLAVILALVFGVAATATGATGDNFLLGKRNVADAISALVKKGPGPALSLVVETNQPPLKVNSQARVANLNAALAGRADSAASADSATNAQNAANADMLDSKDINELPGSVVQVETISGNVSDAEPFGHLVFVTPTVQVTTSSTQRIVGVVSVSLKVVPDPEVAANPLDFNYGLCYRQAGTTNSLVPFYSGLNQTQGTATTTPGSWTAAQTRVPGVAGTWEVGFCAHNSSNQFLTLSGADRGANGWIEVMNAAPSTGG